MATNNDNDLDYVGGLGSAEMESYSDLEFELDGGDDGVNTEDDRSDDGNNRTNDHDVPMTDGAERRNHRSQVPRMRGYASSISTELLNTPYEDEQRGRLLPSDDGDSTDASSIYTTSSFDGRGRRGDAGGGAGSVFSDPDNGKPVKASITTAQSVAVRQMSAALALLPVEDEPPEIVTTEPSASPAIGMSGHWYQTGAASATHGVLATSASASAAWRQRAQPTPRDATEIVAHLPCEFRWYDGCEKTFPLHASQRGIEEWIDHMVTDKKHLNYHLPKSSACWFCDERFDVHPDNYSDERVRAEVYKARMKHNARHFAKLDKLVANPREKDENFMEHLIKHHLWKRPEEARQGGEQTAAASKLPLPSGSEFRSVTYSTRPEKQPGPALEPIAEKRRRVQAPVVSSSGSSSRPRARATVIHQ